MHRQSCRSQVHTIAEIIKSTMEMKNGILSANQYVGATLRIIEMRKSERVELANDALIGFGLNAIDLVVVRNFILKNVEGMVGKLNDLQRWNIIDLIKGRSNSETIASRMRYYGSEEGSIAMFLNFNEAYKTYAKGLKVHELEADFKGVQIATRDSLFDIRNVGYTGYWKLNPGRVRNRKIQLASMSDAGPTPRGYYLNAEVVDVEEVQTNDGVRYKVVLANAVIKNSGNPNVKFNRTPVTYIK
jgi:hypothetical protein